MGGSESMTQHRQLAAIMFTDVVGYSALMSKDEKLAMEVLEKNRSIHKAAIEKHTGQYIKEIGDGTLSIFNSSVDAVNCALDIQKACCKEKDFQVRIGIHIGDVIYKDNDVFGDGVNIASRIESSGEPGGIYISERVFEDVKNKSEISVDFFGEKTLKNIDHPVKIYSIKPGPGRFHQDAANKKANSIAVLPFVNMSPDPEQEYFCEGMAEELINALTRISNLKVVARTSSFSFKDQKTDIREIGLKLNVEMLVEGSIRKAGNLLRITVQLVKVEDGYHLWSEKFDRELEDVFTIQDEITSQIVDRLKATLDPSAKLTGVNQPDNFTAYDLYLKGRYYINKFLPEYTHEAIIYYHKALEEDPRFTLAYTALAEAYTLLSTGFNILPTKDAMPKAREAALKALELDSGQAEAYVSLGMVSMFHDYDRKATFHHFTKALEMNPNSANAHLWFEFYWSFMEGRFEKSMEAILKAQELDPMNTLIKIRIGYVFIYMRDYDRALQYFKKLAESEKDFPMGHHCLMEAYAMKKMYKEALEEGRKMLEAGAKTIANVGVMGTYYALAGHEDRAKIILSDLIERSKQGYISSFWVGAIYHGLGEPSEAFEWFDKAFEERDSNLLYLTTTPPFDSIRPDPRFKKLLIKMGLENLVSRNVNDVNE
jgi:TolB-like protein/class 3 adenylate cyclase/Tfp pilus assembly protein PilF